MYFGGLFALYLLQLREVVVVDVPVLGLVHVSAPLPPLVDDYKLCVLMCAVYRLSLRSSDRWENGTTREWMLLLLSDQSRVCDVQSR